MGIPQRQWLRLRVSLLWAGVQSLIRALRSPRLHSVAKKKKRGEDRKDGWFSVNILYIPVWFANVFCFLMQKRILSGLKGY